MKENAKKRRAKERRYSSNVTVTPGGFSMQKLKVQPFVPDKEPNRGVMDFIAEYEIFTMNATQEQRCLIIDRFLTGNLLTAVKLEKQERKQRRKEVSWKRIKTILCNGSTSKSTHHRATQKFKTDRAKIKQGETPLEFCNRLVREVSTLKAQKYFDNGASEIQYEMELVMKFQSSLPGPAGTPPKWHLQQHLENHQGTERDHQFLLSTE